MKINHPAWNKGVKYFHSASFPKGHIPWNKGKKGVQAPYWLGKKRPPETGKKISEHHKLFGIKPPSRLGTTHDTSEQTRLKISLTKRFDKNWNWKGDKVKYRALHNWVQKKLGKPKQCEHCSTTTAKRFEWANISQKYKREIGDWMRLCSSCHRHYDRGNWTL